MKPLRQSQQKIVQHVLEHPRAGVFASMGVGKSLAMLEALQFLPGPVLIVAPLRVAQTVWHNESVKWNYHYQFSHILGSPASRVEAADAIDADVYVINIENLVWLRNKYEKKWKWKTIVFDESSLLKTPGSKRSRAALWASRRADNVILLTGTPSPNGLQDLYHQIKILDGGKRLGRSVEVFRKNFCFPENPYFEHTRWLVREDKVDSLHQAIDDICISLTTEDYADMPDMVVNDIEVRLDLHGRSEYDTMKDEMIIDLEGETVTAATAGSLVAKLGQLASGAIYTAEKGNEYLETDDRKLQALDDIIEEAAGQPIIIWYGYVHSMDRIWSRYDKKHTVRAISHPDAIADWNAGKIDILLAHPQSGGHGLNLQHGGHIAVWYDMTWNLEHYQQANARLARPGQGQPVFVHRLIASNTIDEEIAAAVESKASVQSILMGALK